MRRRPTVLLAEGQALVAAALRQALEARFELLDVVCSADELGLMLRKRLPDAVVANLAVLDLESLAALRAEHTGTRFTAYSEQTDGESVRTAFANGADAYLWTGSKPLEFAFAVEETLEGRSYVTPAATPSLIGGLLESPKPRADTDEDREFASERIGVLVVDDHPSIRAGMDAMLSEDPTIRIVGTAANGRQALERTAELGPDIVLMDVMMPEMNGVAATEAILAGFPNTKVLLMSSLSAAELVLEAIRIGASGYISKRFEPEELGAAIRGAHRGETFLHPEITEGLLPLVENREEASQRLTNREVDVARLVAEGFSNQQIADRARVSIGTVRTHLRNIFEKLGVSNRVELALYALRSGWASLEPS